MDSLLLYKILRNRTGAEISASGNPATLPGTLKNNPMNEMKIFGRSKWETTTGAQLWEFGDIKSSVVAAKKFSTSLKKGKYTITADIESTDTDSETCLVTIGKKYINLPREKGVSATFELTEESAEIRVYASEDYNNSVGDTVSLKNVMLNVGDTALPYEPYTGGKPSPSPEYPQEIESTGTGSTNLFDKDSISVNYVIEVDGKLVLSAGYDSSDFIPVSSGTYTITATGSVRCKTYDKDKKPFTINTYTDININNGGTFEIAKNVKYIRFSMYHPNVDTIMLNRGSTALPYEAYKSGMIDVTVHGKNLFDLEYALNKNNWSGPSGYWYIPYYVGKGNTVSVTYGAEIPVGLRAYICIHDYPGKTDNAKMWLYHSVGGNLTNNKCTFIAETDYIYLNAAGDYLSVIKKYMADLQIEVSPSPTGYEPYHTPQSLSIQTPTGLQAIPVTSGGNYTDTNGQQWIADYIDLKRGKYVQNVTTLELMGDENFKYGTDSNTQNILGGLYTVTFALGNIINKMVISNAFVQVINTWTPKIEYVKEKKVSVFTLTNAQAVVFVLDATVFPTKEDFALFLKTKKDAGNPVVLYYTRREPIERNLTQSEVQAYQELTTYAGTTIVENDAECYMEVSAGGGDALRAKKMALILGD